MTRQAPLRFALLLWVVSCGGRLTVDSQEPGYRDDPDGAALPSAGTKANGGSPSNSAGATTIGGTDSARAGEHSVAGTSAVGGADESAGTGGDVGNAGASNAGTNNAGAGGAFACDEVPDAPGDCHSVSCDGTDHATRKIDQTDLPTLENPCLAGTCNAAGKPDSTPRDARTACGNERGGVMCNGVGGCVECLKSDDCPAKQNCSREQTCVPDPCTDVNCGGACPTCDDGKKCLVDSDCTSYACDSLTLTCIADSCKDHHQDHNETDADCGGGICVGCALTQGCNLNLDCKSQACDTLSLTCVGNQCADHRQDGDETDKDCGGGYCPGCLNGKKCENSFDCAVGLCTPGVPHVCYTP